MREIKTTRLLPKWLTSENPDDALIGDMPEIGYAPDLPPRIPARVVAKANSVGLSFDSLCEILQSIQHIVVSIAYELVNGVDLSFDDRRKIRPEIFQFARIHAEPFEEGSFIIHAELEDREDMLGEKRVSTRAVIARLIEVMAGVPNKGYDFNTSLAVLRSIEEFDKALKRDVERIELAPSASPEEDFGRPAIVIDPNYVLNVTNAREQRLSRRTEFGQITGMLRAVDTVRHTMKLEDVNRHSIVHGEYAPALESKMIALLGQFVQIRGHVSYRSGNPTKLKVSQIDRGETGLLTQLR